MEAKSKFYASGINNCGELSTLATFNDIRVRAKVRTFDFSSFRITVSLPVPESTFIMNGSKFVFRAIARRNFSVPSHRYISTSNRLWYKQENDAVTPTSGEGKRFPDNADEFRETQKSRPLNPHMTNTTSANYNEKAVPKVGVDKAPPELISAVDQEYTPKDRQPENTERMTGGTQPGDPDNVSGSEYAVGEMEGAKFKIEPLRRTGEDTTTMRARLLCPSTPD